MIRLAFAFLNPIKKSSDNFMCNKIIELNDFLNLAQEAAKVQYQCIQTEGERL